MSGLQAQQFDDLGQAVGRGIAMGQAGARGHAARIGCQRIGYPRDRQNEIHVSGGDRAARHAVVTGLVRVLRDDEPVLFLDRLESQAAVRTGA